MNPILKGKWLSDKVLPSYGSAYYSRELMLNIISIEHIKVAVRDSKGKWAIRPNIFEIVGNQVQLRGMVYYMVETVLDNNNIVLHDPYGKYTYYMLRVPNPS